MNTVSIAGIAATNGTVEIATTDQDNTHQVIQLTPTKALEVALALGDAAKQADHTLSTVFEKDIGPEHQIRSATTRKGNARLEWTTGGFVHRLVIAGIQLRVIADQLHDVADRLEERK